MENKIEAASVLNHSMFEINTTSKEKTMMQILVSIQQTLESNISGDHIFGEEKLEFDLKLTENTKITTTQLT